MDRERAKSARAAANALFVQAMTAVERVDTQAARVGGEPSQQRKGL
jgi:hypothetical protein